MKWYFKVLHAYSDFTGRARRREYWMFMLFHLLILVLVSTFSTRFESGVGAHLDVVYGMAVLIPGLAVTVRRLHDTGRTGWWAFLGLVPIVAVILVVLLCLNGERGGNVYGPDPKIAEA